MSCRVYSITRRIMSVMYTSFSVSSFRNIHVYTRCTAIYAYNTAVLFRSVTPHKLEQLNLSMSDLRSVSTNNGGVWGLL